jgi:hypothetical protein
MRLLIERPHSAVSNCEDALTDDRTFHPEFTHQVFGDSEKIYGYEDLKIQVCRATACIFKDMPFTTRASHAQGYWQAEMGNRLRATTN